MMNPRAKYIRLRILLVGVIFAAAFVTIGGKALLLQVYQGSWLSRKASDQVEDSLKAVGKRGTIFDRRGHAMAVSIDVTSIAIRPAQVKDSETAAKELARVLKRKPQEMKERLASRKPFVWLKRQATPKETEAVKQLRIPGIEFVSETNRFYPNRGLKVFKPTSEALSLIVNYQDPDRLDKLASFARVPIGNVRYASTNRAFQGVGGVEVSISPAEATSRAS